MKDVRVFLSENFQFLEMKFSIYLNRHVRNYNITYGDLVHLVDFPPFFIR